MNNELLPQINTQDTGIQVVLKKIQDEDITPLSKRLFHIRLIAVVAVILAVCIVTVFLLSYIVFGIRMGGYASLLDLGLTGWQVFLMLFPWTLLLIDLALIGVLEWLLRSFKFCYRLPSLYLLPSVVVIVLLGGYVIDRFHVHDAVMGRSQDAAITFLKGFYESNKNPTPPPNEVGIFRATVTGISGNLLMVNFDDTMRATSTPIGVFVEDPAFLRTISVGERVFIKGQVVNGTLQAQAISKVFKPTRPF